MGTRLRFKTKEKLTDFIKSSWDITPIKIHYNELVKGFIVDVEGKE